MLKVLRSRRCSTAVVALAACAASVSTPNDTRGATALRAAASDVDAVRQKLRHLAVAMHAHHDSRLSFPPSEDAKGQRLSWRVHLLPYVGQAALYQRFNLSEPWDSPHNSELAQHMPEVFRLLDGSAPETRIVVFTGPATLFQPGRRSTFRALVDGVANTVMLAISDEPRTWTQPSDIEFVPSTPSRSLASINGRFEFALFDTNLLSLPTNIDAPTLAGLITVGGEEIIDGAGLRRQHGPDTQPDVASAVESIKAIAATKNESMQRVKRVALAMHNHHDARRGLPPVWGWSKAQEGYQRGPAISWRVLLLPYLDQQTVFRRYDRTQPWDAGANAQLLDSRPAEYESPAPKSPSETQLHVVQGKRTLFPSPAGSRSARGTGFRSITDGASKTLMAVEAGPETSGPWTQPSAIPYREEDPLGALGTLPVTGFPAAMADGSVRWLHPDIDTEVFRSLLLRDDRR